MDRKLMKEVGIKSLFVDAETATKVKMLDEKMKELQKETQVSKRVLKNASTNGSLNDDFSLNLQEIRGPKKQCTDIRIIC